MGRLYRNKNGFTLLEMLVVLLIVSILSFGLSTQMNTSLYLLMKKVQTLSITAQEKAYVEHQRIDMSVNSKINVGDIEYCIPKDIVCDPVSFYYNTKGNISKALTLRCQNANSKMKLVYQLGTGRVRLEKE